MEKSESKILTPKKVSNSNKKIINIIFDRFVNTKSVFSFLFLAHIFFLDALDSVRSNDKLGTHSNYIVFSEKKFALKYGYRGRKQWILFMREHII